jgi:hypothetical protein
MVVWKAMYDIWQLIHMLNDECCTPLCRNGSSDDTSNSWLEGAIKVSFGGTLAAQRVHEFHGLPEFLLCMRGINA